MGLKKENRERMVPIGKIALFKGEFGWSTRWEGEGSADRGFGITEVSSAASAVCYLLGMLEDNRMFKKVEP